MKLLHAATLIAASLSVVALSSFFIVTDHESAIVTQFGKTVKHINGGGIYFKLPWPLQTVYHIDKRLNLLQSSKQETMTRDRRNIIAPSFAVWHVTDAIKFFETLADKQEASKKLESILVHTQNAALAKRDFTELFSCENTVSALPEIELEMLTAMNTETEKLFGITVLQVGLLQLTLPASNTRTVLERMRAENFLKAAQIRAEGIERSSRIRAEAQAQRTQILAAAEAEAAKILGEGEAEATRILREAYEKNPALFEFVRELEVLQNVISPNTMLILGTDAPPFRMITQDPEAR